MVVNAATSAPASLLTMVDYLRARGVPANLAGVVPGPNEAPYGYHYSPNFLLHDPRSLYGSGDASLHGVLNSPAPAGFASAVDISFSLTPDGTAADWMRLVTGRLVAAAKAGDPRLTSCVREIAGTTDGKTTHAVYLPSKTEDFGQWDSSHLTHIHISFGRSKVTDAALVRGVADVMVGKPLPAGGGGPVETEEDDMALLLRNADKYVKVRDPKTKKVSSMYCLPVLVSGSQGVVITDPASAVAAVTAGAKEMQLSATDYVHARNVLTGYSKWSTNVVL